jgi:hypothetical protein
MKHICEVGTLELIRLVSELVENAVKRQIAAIRRMGVILIAAF